MQISHVIPPSFGFALVNAVNEECLDLALPEGLGSQRSTLNSQLSDLHTQQSESEAIHLQI